MVNIECHLAFERFLAMLYFAHPMKSFFNNTKSLIGIMGACALEEVSCARVGLGKVSCTTKDFILQRRYMH